MTETRERLPAREARALAMLRDGFRVARARVPGRFIVESQSGNGVYEVDGVGIPDGFESCTCPDFTERIAPCKHVFFVRNWLAGESDQANDLFEPGTETIRRAKRNYSLADKAQTQEGRLLRVLLAGLADSFPEPRTDPRRAGRKPVPLRDQFFCAVQRSYYGFSLRRSHDFRELAVEKDLLPRPYFYSLVSHFLCREDVTAGLNDALARSAIPSFGVENICAMDATGLRTTQFHYYAKEKYDPSRENVWLKLHAMAGIRTHAIPVLEVTAGQSNDSPMFPVLMKRAYEYGFRFEEILADKGYQSRSNFNVAALYKVLPFIPFKKNQTGQSKGSPMYHKMFQYYQYHREEFDEHYGQRAQIESTFAAIKQKLTETLSSRKFTSQANEILCLAIAHNLMVLIRQMFETNIVPEFLRPPAHSHGDRVPTQPVGPSLFLNPQQPWQPVPQSAVFN